jgi:uncharacterized membrane protein
VSDSKKRSLIKSVTWYFSDMFMTIIIAFIVTRDIRVSLGIGVLQQTWEVGLYYFHERVWSRVK